MAEKFILAVEAGRVPAGLREALAEAVLDDELARLAMEVREGVAFATRRAIRLAELLLDGAGSSERVRTATEE